MCARAEHYLFLCALLMQYSVSFLLSSMDEEIRAEDYTSSDDGLLSSVEKNGTIVGENSCDPSLYSIEKIISITEFESRDVLDGDCEVESDIEIKETKWKRPAVDTFASVLALEECIRDEVISPSKLCLEAKKKTSLPLDTIQVNVSAPSSSASSDSDYGFNESMYVVSKLRDLPKLHRAVWRGDLLKVKSICNGIRKTVLNTRDKESRTALHYACAKGSTEIISYLCSHLKSIIDANLKDLNGCTPMHKLIDNGYGCDGALEHLIDCGGDFNLFNNFGHTPLHLAARRGDTLTTSFLIFKGASVHAMDEAGRTPLHLAAQNNHEGVITNLIMYGADIRSKDKMGRTPIMSTKKERIAKFMCDLISDQENRNQLLTEADYSGTSIASQEISSLQPPSGAEIRAQILNEWNDLKSNDTSEDCFSETSSCKSYSTQKDSFQSACWGNVAGKNISTTTSDEFTSLKASPVMEITSKNLDDELDSNHSVVSNFTDCPKLKEITDSSSKNSLERYYSVASAFNCDHFKSLNMRSTTNSALKNDSCCFSVTIPAIYQSDCSCSAITPDRVCISNPNTQHCESNKFENEGVSSRNAVHCFYGINSCSTKAPTRSNSTGQLLTKEHQNSIHKCTSASALLYSKALNLKVEPLQPTREKYQGKQPVGELLTPLQLLQKPMQFTEDVTGHQNGAETQTSNTSQENTICKLKKQLNWSEEKILGKNDQDDLVSELRQRLEECEQGNQLLIQRLHKTATEKQALLKKIEEDLGEREKLFQELEDAKGANQELLFTLKDADEKKQQMLQLLHSTTCSKREEHQKLNASNALIEELQLEVKDVKLMNQKLLEKLQCPKSEIVHIEPDDTMTNEQVLQQFKESNKHLKRRLTDAENGKAEILQQLRESNVAKGKLQLEVVHAKNAYEELIKKIDEGETTKNKLIKEVEHATLTKEECLKELEVTRETIVQLKQKLIDANSANTELVGEVEDAAIAKMEMFQDIEDARSEIEALKQRVNETFSSKEDLMKEVEEAVVAKMELFQELQNAKSANEELEEQLKSAIAGKEKLLLEVQASKHQNESNHSIFSDAKPDIKHSKKLKVSEATLTLDEVNRVECSRAIKDRQYKEEVIELSKTLQSMNSELMEMMKFSEQQVSDVKMMKDEWVQERSEMSHSLSEMSSSLQKEIKEKEQILHENNQLKTTVENLKEQLAKLQNHTGVNGTQSTHQTSRLNFFESKSLILESALLSAQCMARGLSQQVATLQQNCHKQEAALLMANEETSKSEDEARRLEQRIKELEQTLGICKRRIIEQNENNAHLLEKNKSMQRTTEQHRWNVSGLTGCSLYTAKIKSLEHTIAVLRREVEYSRTSCSLLEENGKYAKTEIHRLNREMAKLQSTVNKNAALLDERERDARETRKIIEEQLRFKDQTIAAYMKKVKTLAEQHQDTQI